MTTEQFPARGEYAPGSLGHIKRELADARELLAAIRDDEVNAQDEADKFLRDNKFSALHAALKEAERLKAHAEAMAPVGMLEPLRIIGDRLLAHYGNRFCLTRPTLHTDNERQVLVAALKALRAGLAYRAEFKVES